MSEIEQQQNLEQQESLPESAPAPAKILEPTQLGVLGSEKVDPAAQVAPVTAPAAQATTKQAASAPETAKPVDYAALAKQFGSGRLINMKPIS
jgi:hypothetical protein